MLNHIYMTYAGLINMDQ